MAWDKNTQYAVRDRLAALEKFATDQDRENKALRALVAVLQKTLDQLLGLHKRDAQYLEFLKDKVAKLKK